jgi:hypothetical protein
MGNEIRRRTGTRAGAPATRDSRTHRPAAKDPSNRSGPVSFLELSPATKNATSRVLDVPPRLQWKNGHGYCGETSIQSIGLHFGAWISQQVIRDLAKGELLLGVNEHKALSALHFDFVTWDSDSPTPQFESFAVWMKQQLLKGRPTIFTVFITDGDGDPDYDHIMPAVGIRSTSATAFDRNDVLVFNTNLGAQLERALKDLVGTRKSCSTRGQEGGSVPKKIDYGVALKGIKDKRQATLPVSLSVSSAEEPNVSLKESPSQMTATATVGALQPGQRYALLRYDDFKSVPTDASAQGFLKSRYAQKVEFTADGATWTYRDQRPFSSDRAIYYRCVPLAGSPLT